MTAIDVLSTLRITLALVIAGASTLFFPPQVAGAVLFAFLLGVATDVAGVRRTEGRMTPRGRVLDSLADKTLVYAVLFPLARSGFPPLFLALLLMARDGAALASQVVAARRGQVLRVSGIGQLKTAILYLSCAALLTLTWLQSATGPLKVDPGDLGTILPFLLGSQLGIVVAFLLSLDTVVGYITAVQSRTAA